MTKTPILFITFNRFNETKIVLDKIKDYKPNKLYISSDGPRDNIFGELNKVSDIREFLLDNINWECELYTKFIDTNIGCNLAVTGAIDWFFENEEQGIILEDDCLPSDNFFIFCNTMLEKYKNDNRISGISGTNFNIHLSKSVFSYFFSDILNVWGWATWKRSWIIHKNFYNLLNNDFKYISFYDKKINQSIFDYANLPLTTWDYKMWLTFYASNMLAIIPTSNLVKNIGFTEDATLFKTNTKYFIKKFQRDHNDFNLNINHPITFRSNYLYDLYIYTKILNYKKFNKKIFIIKFFGESFFKKLKFIKNQF